MQRIDSMAHSVSGPVHWFTLATAINIFEQWPAQRADVEFPRVDFCRSRRLAVLLAGGACTFAVNATGAQENGEARERESLLYLLLLFTVPVVLALVAGFLYGTYDVKYVAFCAAPYYILVARGLSLGELRQFAG